MGDVARSLSVGRLVKGAFKNYIDKKGWVGGQSNVYTHKVKDIFSLTLSVYEGWVGGHQKSVHIVIELNLGMKTWGSLARGSKVWRNTKRDAYLGVNSTIETFKILPCLRSRGKSLPFTMFYHPFNL